MMSPPCKLCHGLEKKKEDDARLALDFCPQELLNSVKRGKCSSCALILNAVTHFGEAAWAQSRDSGSSAWSLVDDITRIYVYGLSTDRDTLSLELYPRKDEPKRILELFYPEHKGHTHVRLVKGSLINRVMGSPMRLNSVKTRPSTSSHPLSENGLKWATDRIQYCLSKHEFCARARKTPLPKRVLAFQLASSRDVFVQLLEESKSSAEYATLSYRWGSHQTCITTRATLEKHKKDIPWSHIPPTFRDGIRFCLAIGINYLWIDALCIVQDDPSDWQMEAARMADIYQNSYITLAATSSSSGSEGLFHEKPTSKLECSLNSQSAFIGHQGGSHSLWNQALSRLKYLYSKATAKTGSIIKVREKAYHWGDSASKENIVRLYPLLARGWAFQERILSARVLHFCSDEMVWECNMEILCECGSLPVSRNPRELFNDIISSDTLPERRAHAVTPTDALLPDPELPAYDEDGLSFFSLEGKSGILHNNLHADGYQDDHSSSSLGTKSVVSTASLSPPYPENVENTPTLPAGEQLNEEVAQYVPLQPSPKLAAERTIHRAQQSGSNLRPDEKTFHMVNHMSYRRSEDEISFHNAFRKLLSRDPKHLPSYSPRAWIYRVQNELPMSSKQWQAIVSQYSSLHLTKDTDRLPALSGLADRASPHLGRYLAGLWSTTFPSDLTWRVRALEAGSRRRTDYLGPSWSWASVDGAVSYWDNLRTEITKPEVPGWHRRKPTWKSWAVEPRGENPFGEVASGEAIVRGYLRPVRLQYVWTRPWLMNENHEHQHESVHDPLKYEISIVEGLELPLFADHVLSEEGPHQIVNSAELHLLLIHPDIFLVLQSLPESRGGFPAYRRVGIVRQPEAFTSVYNGGVDLMAQSVQDTIALI